MKSHHYEFSRSSLVRGICGPLLPVAVFALAIHIAARAGWLPAPRPALDVDRTIIVHQAERSRSQDAAAVVLIGDSSCLMDVMADDLGVRLQKPVLNLGTLSYLNLESYGSMIKEFAEANPGHPETVLLLMHPHALRLPQGERYQMDLLRHFLAGDDHCRQETIYDRVACSLGLEIFRGRLLARAIPAPLPAAFGGYYGFTRELEAFMTKHRGSVVEPVREEKLAGATEYRLSPFLEGLSHAFRAAVPSRSRLLAGITPVPASLAGRNYDMIYEELLVNWCRWLEAEPLRLPPSYPDELFGRPTHLTADGGRVYTERLARELAALGLR